MAKKRRDKERDSSSISKVAKVGTAALAVGVGAASFRKTTSTYRNIVSEALPAAIKTQKTISKDFRDLRSVRKGFDKRLSAKDIKKVYQDNFVNKNTFDINRKQLQGKALKFNTDSKKMSVFGKTKNFIQVKSGSLDVQLQEAYKSMRHERSINTLVSKYDDKQVAHIQELALDAFKQINESTYHEDGKVTFTDLLQKKFKAFGFNSEERQGFLEYISKQSEEIDIASRNPQAIKEAKEKITKHLENNILEGSRHSNLKISKLNNFVKKTTGFDFNIEDKLIGTKSLTYADYKELKMNNPNHFDESNLTTHIKNKSKSKGVNVSKLDTELENIIDNSGENFDDLIMDKSIKVYRDKDGKLQTYSTAELDNLLEGFYNKFSSTTLGRLFGQTDARLSKEVPMISIMKAGLTGKEAAYELGNTGTRLLRAKIALVDPSNLMGELFDLSIVNDELTFNEEALSKGRLFNNRHGKRSRLTKEIVGTNRNAINTWDTALGEILDIGQDGSPSLLQKVSSFFTKFKDEDWQKNILKESKKFITDESDTMDYIYEKAIDLYSKNPELSIDEAKAQVASKIFSNHKEISAMLNNYSAAHQIDADSISVLKNSGLIKDVHSKKILEALDNKDLSPAQLLEAISINQEGMIKLHNKDLENIANRSLIDLDHVLSMQNISKFESAGFINIDSTNVMSPEDIIKREAIKEVLLREGSVGMGSNSYRGSYDAGSLMHLETILQNESLDYRQQKNLRYLANWGLMQDTLSLQNDIDANFDLSAMIGPNGNMTKFKDLVQSNSHFKAKYNDMIDDLSSRHNMFDSGQIGNLNEVHVDEYNAFSFQKQSVLNLDNLLNINSINDAIKIAGQAKQELLAGRHDLNNYTTLTQIPQFMVSRLLWGVEDFGLDFSSASTKSNLDLIKNIGLKRILPAMAAFSLYDYADYESENITGISLTGAAANTLSNIDLASRRLAYSTGIGQALDWAKETSVIGEYWTGSSDFQTQEERRDWYENGYQAVRGGRLWGIGSTSEFRGSGIQYYQQNYLRRAHSNWKEVGIYGSAEEKFSHSWLPSLRHPLSPLKAMWDPYWLEKKNMDSRPYPLTGKMFQEGTPWGAILNPTVGEILKPVRMLPEVKKRLGNDGRDIRNVLEGINNRIKNRGNENEDLLLVKGTDIRTGNYVPYANTGDGAMNVSFNNGQVNAAGLGYMNDVNNIRDFVPANGIIPEEQMQQEAGGTNQSIASVNLTSEPGANISVNSILEFVNKGIRKAAEQVSTYRDTSNSANSYIPNLPNRQDSTYVYTNLVSKRNVFNSEYYSSNYDPKMIDKNLANNYMKDGAYSIRQLSGIYNFLGDLAFGEQSYTFEYENAGAMAGFSRHFWDAQAGGIGGGFMEIARRFFPSEDRSRIKYNPLKNNMEDWLPDRFKTGDAYASLPKGEMRLPGEGYLTMNDLHSDRFGLYGAFDRFKILGDVAPTSEEYKIWRNIARNTVTDPELIKRMDEIEERATKMSSKHDFYDYRYYNNNLETNEGVVKSWEGNVVTLASGEQLKLGGINLTQDADLSQVLQVGQKIHYRTSEDAIKKLEDGLVTNAVIYKKENGFGVNINKTLVDYGMAERDKKDKSAIGYMAHASAMQQTLGSIQEVISHAQIPIIHNKFMKIETARESYRNEHIYGTSFATWDHPIKGFINPMLNQTYSQSMPRHALAAGSAFLHYNMKYISEDTLLKYGSGALMYMTNPAALLGSGIEGMMNLGVKAVGGDSNLLNIERGGKLGAIVGTVGWGLANAENPLKAVSSFAIAGELASKYLNVQDLFTKETKDVTGKMVKQITKNIDGKGALVGAGIGLAIAAIKNPGFDKDMFRSKWIPKATEKKYELDEYFDRLEYLKYKSLYEQASFRSFMFESKNINIKSIFNKLDKNKEKIAKLTRKAEKLSNKYSSGGYEYEIEMSKIQNQINALQNQQIAFKGGKYTKAAVSYKKAMESTVYGLSEGATPDEILSAVPVQYKDHFMAFMNERSEKERNKILKQLPEYLRRPLQIAWGQKPERIESNRKYFKDHKLPGMAWKGWKPNVNLKHVKMKTIQNEGMLLSDFGYYESEKSKMEYHMAPDINDFEQGQSGLSYLANMTSAMTGLGMSVQNISVEPTSAPGLWIMGDIKQSAKDVSKVGSYAVASGLQGITSLLF